MEYVSLGTTGLQVSRICLGCMSYGEPDRGNQPWSLDRDAAQPFFRSGVRARHQLLRHCQRVLSRK